VVLNPDLFRNGLFFDRAVKHVSIFRHVTKGVGVPGISRSHQLSRIREFENHLAQLTLLNDLGAVRRYQVAHVSTNWIDSLCDLRGDDVHVDLVRLSGRTEAL